MTRKKLLLIVILVVVIIVLLIVNLLVSNERTSACQDLIYGMEEGDTERTYNMLSQPARNNMSLEQWREQVNYIEGVYNGIEKPIELIDSEESESVASDQKITSETYRVVTDFGPWHATCTFYESDNGLISNFTSDIGV